MGFVRIGRLASVAACALSALVVGACALAPAELPDDEVDLTTKRPAGSGASSDRTPPSESKGGGELVDPPPPPVAPVRASIDGTALTIDEAELWSDVSKAGTYDAFIRVSGPGIAPGTDIWLSARRKGTGCEVDGNMIAYRPGRVQDPQYLPKGEKSPACGLEIFEIPTAIGQHFRGSFHATLYSINVTPATTKEVDLDFDIVRKE